MVVCRIWLFRGSGEVAEGGMDIKNWWCHRSPNRLVGRRTVDLNDEAAGARDQCGVLRNQIDQVISQGSMSGISDPRAFPCLSER